MPIFVDASRESWFEKHGVKPAFTHYAHGADEPCGWCDAPPHERQRRGVFPESRREEK